jgi:hypothetical protein
MIDKWNLGDSFRKEKFFWWSGKYRGEERPWFVRIMVVGASWSGSMTMRGWHLLTTGLGRLSTIWEVQDNLLRIWGLNMYIVVVLGCLTLISWEILELMILYRAASSHRCTRLVMNMRYSWGLGVYLVVWRLMSHVMVNMGMTNVTRWLLLCHMVNMRGYILKRMHPIIVTMLIFIRSILWHLLIILIFLNIWSLLNFQASSYERTYMKTRWLIISILLLLLHDIQQ